MFVVPIQSLPNQELTIVLDGILYDLAIRETVGCMSMDVTRAGVVVVQGQRCVADAPVLPYVSLEGPFGNFVFITNDGDLPYWDQFGSSQILMFGTSVEIAAARAA